jgi:glycosyltransferase involved in cell wall biosynthesis
MLKVIVTRSRIIDPSFYKIANTLSNIGYSVKVVVWDRTGKNNVIKTNSFVIISFGLKAPYDKITAAFFLPVWWFYELIILLLEPVDIIHACDFDTLLPAIIVKFIKKVKLAYTIFDFYADNIPIGINILRNFVAFLEKLFISKADAVFIVDPSRYEQIKGASIRRLAIIYNSPPDYLNRRQKNETKDLQKREFVIFYSGNIHRSRGLIEILKAICKLEGIKFLVAGTGSDIRIFEKLPSNLSTKVEYLGFISYDEVLKRTLEADVIIALYDPKIPNNRYASPNKLFEAMMCAKPIIINKETAAARIVEKFNCGITVPYGDVEAIRNAIKLLKEKSDYRLVLGQNGRKAYMKYFEWKLMEKRLISAYNEFLQE